MLVLGGGAIGLELTQVFARFGVQVTVIEGSDRILAMEEPESSEAKLALERDGVVFRTGVHAKAVNHSGDGFTVTMDDGGTVSGEKLLVATGRRVDIRQLGLDQVGLDARRIEVDERVQAGDGVTLCNR